MRYALRVAEVFLVSLGLTTAAGATPGLLLTQSIPPRLAALGEGGVAVEPVGSSPAVSPALDASASGVGAQAWGRELFGGGSVGFVAAQYVGGGFGVMAAAGSLDTGSVSSVAPDGSAISVPGQEESVYAVGGSIGLLDALDVGGTVKTVRAKLLGSYSAAAWGADFGMRVKVAEGLRLGAALTNAGGRLRLATDAIDLPTVARVGAAYSLSLASQADGPAVLVCADVAQDVILADRWVSAGLEVGPFGPLVVRGGGVFTQLPVRTATATAGLGVGVDGLEFDYAIRFGDTGLGTLQTAGLTLSIPGVPRGSAPVPPAAVGLPSPGSAKSQEVTRSRDSSGEQGAPGLDKQDWQDPARSPVGPAPATLLPAPVSGSPATP